MLRYFRWKNIVYFILLGLVLLVERWIVEFGDTRGGGIDFTPFMQVAFLKLTVFLFIVCDLFLHKRSLRIAGMIVQFVFILWSFKYYFYMQGWTDYLQGHVDIPEYETLVPPSVDTFVFLWVCCNVVILYLLIAVGISCLIKKIKVSN